MKLKMLLNPNITLPLAIVLGAVCGFADIPWVHTMAGGLSEIFMNLLRMVSLPIIFLSIVSTSSSMGSVSEIRFLGQKVVKYTLLTTVFAALLALFYFLLLNPVKIVTALPDMRTQLDTTSYFEYLHNLIPSNIVKPFVENNVIGVLFIAMMLSLSILSLPEKNRTILHGLFSSLFQAIMKITSWIVIVMPIGIFSFVDLFIRDYKSGLEFESIGLYLLVVVLANITQAVVVLPILLKMKGVPPLKLARAMSEALWLAFFTKSSNATLPMAVKCAEERGGVSRKIAGFSFPLCTSINMNGCAAFILTTVLFVAMSNGLTFSFTEMILWVVIATIAAVGNAGVPMGCFFLSSALLAAMNVPLNILGIILPIYTLIDMLETAINVWSDSCVTAIVDKEVMGTKPAPAAAYVPATE